MRPRNEYHDARRVLIKLLAEPDDGPVNIEKLGANEREFLKATCTMTVLLYQICFTAGFDAAASMEGFEALTESVKRTIYLICDEQLPEDA